MSSDLIAWIVAIGLGAVVVAVGMRRNLSETTRSNLPRYGDPEPSTATVGPSEGERRRRPLSPRQARWLASLYLVWGIFNAVVAVQSSDDRLFRVGAAAVFLLGGVLLLLRKWPYFSGAPGS